MAMIGTAATGAAVSLATILVVALVSKDVREWIVRGQAAIAEAAGLVDNNKKLAGQIESRERTIADRDREIQAQSEEVQRQKALLASQRRELVPLRSEVTRLRGVIPDLREEIAQSRASVNAIERQLKDARARILTSRNRLTEINQKLATNRSQLKASDQLLTEAMTQKNELTRENTELMLEQSRLEEQIRLMQNEVVRLETSRNEMEAARNQAVEQLAVEQRELAERQAELRRVEQELLTTRQRLNAAALSASFYQDISTTPRVAPLTFRIQEEVARLPVEVGSSQASAENAMYRLLRAARLAAVERGARPNDVYPEAGIFERRDPDTREVIAGEELERRLVAEIVRSDQPLVLVAYSSLNAFRGEPVSLDVVLYPNPVIYRPGQVVAESRVDGRRDEAEIFRQVSDLVSSKVRERARLDRMIPRSGADEAFGSVPGEMMLRLVSDVKAAERPVRLLALAANETRAGDPLKLSFQIR
jgi:predicted  nucleic acid-binding Zn-ribbon protein